MSNIPDKEIIKLKRIEHEDMDIWKELVTCYIEQFGFDVIIGNMHGLDLKTVIDLQKIEKEVYLGLVE